MTVDDFIFRDARPDDRDEVLAFTAHTWEHGDYIRFVFDRWQSDPQGRFLIIEDTASERIAGIDKLTMLAPGEAWFEGLRIREEYRGQGLATRVQSFMIREAKRLGAHVVRFITRVGNTPIHLAGYRDGFVQTALLRGFEWEGESGTPGPSDGEAFQLRRATPEEADLLYEGWVRSSAYRTAGLVNLSWSLRSSSVEEWVKAAQGGYLLARSGPIAARDQLPVACVLLRPGGEKDEQAWTVSAVSALESEWTPLVRGLIVSAQAGGIGRIEGLLPDDHLVYKATQAAGIKPHADDFCHCLFELDLGKMEA